MHFGSVAQREMIKGSNVPRVKDLTKDGRNTRKICRQRMTDVFCRKELIPGLTTLNYFDVILSHPWDWYIYPHEWLIFMGNSVVENIQFFHIFVPGELVG